MESKPRTKFILEVGKSGVSFEDICCISTLDPIALFKFAAGKINLSKEQKDTLAAILGQNPDELFEHGKGAKHEI